MRQTALRPGGHDIYVDDKGNVSAADRILPETLPANPNPVLKEFFDYYRMPRGFHARSVNSTGAWNATMPLSFMNMPLLSYASEVTIPTLIVTGEQAHSRYFAEDAFKAIGSKEKALVIVPGANHVDLYDNAAGKIPFATFAQFLKPTCNSSPVPETSPSAACGGFVLSEINNVWIT
jgi:fermentation-respiration switch protein FrsA (DUF1100 family)